MAKARLHFDGDNSWIEKEARTYSLTQEVEDKLDSISNFQNEIDGLQDQINNLASRGRYLSTWNAVTGLPETNPQVDPYVYRAWDYYIVSIVWGTNYRPQGSEYHIWVASQAVETQWVEVNDLYIYDWVQWIKQWSGGWATTTWWSITWTLSSQTDLQNALNNKANVIDVLEKTNTTSFTPSWDYNPATKKYVDDIKPTSWSTAPSTTPTFVGQQYVDTTADKMYVATGTSSSSDWMEVWAWSWDVVWPSSATDWHLAVFDGVTWKLIKDWWAVPTVPTNVSDFNNDAWYITGISSSDVTTALWYTPQAPLTAWGGIDITSNTISADEILIDMANISVWDDWRVSWLVAAFFSGRGVTIVDGDNYYKVWKATSDPTDPVWEIYASNAGDDLDYTSGYIFTGDSYWINSITPYTHNFFAPENQWTIWQVLKKTSTGYDWADDWSEKRFAMPYVGDDIGSIVTALFDWYVPIFGDGNELYKVYKWDNQNNIIYAFTVQHGSNIGYSIVYDSNNEVTASTQLTDDYFTPWNTGSTGQVLKKTANGYEWANESWAVTSVNWQTWAVTLDADDIDDTNTTNKFVTTAEKSTWNWKQDALTWWTNWDVLTNVNWTPTWQQPSGWDVMVSSQTWNQFTPWMKIWWGSSSDLSQLTQDLNTLYMAY